jgi:hypothetical protein
MTDSIDFLGRLVERFPELGKDYAAHVVDNGGALPHVFFGRVTDAVVAAYCCDAEGAKVGESADNHSADNHSADNHSARESSADGDAALDWRAVLGFFEETYPVAPLPVKELIVTRFLMDLPWPREPGYGLTVWLGPVLAWKFVQVRPGG